MKLLSLNADAKTIKSNNAGSDYLTAILYLAPSDTVKGIDTCPAARIAGCREACLYSAGRAKLFPAIKEARIRKTELFRDNRGQFLEILKKDVSSFIRKCEKLGKKPAIRLNGTSDIQWENVRDKDGLSMMERFQDVQWYDYTKLPGRKVPGNYHLTVSFSAAYEKYARNVIASDKNIAVVFRTKELPGQFAGRKVINGDKTDLRFLDPANVVVGLYAKGDAKKDRSGFVVDI